MNLLEKIGIIAIGASAFLAIRYYIRYRQEKSAKFTEKARILVDNHPELNPIFREYLKKEQERISQSHKRKYDEEYEYDDGYRGSKKEIFGRKYNVFYSNIDIEQNITQRIAELEQDENEKEFINQVIEDTKVRNFELIKNYEIEIHEISAKLLKYDKTLKLIFPNDKTRIEHKTIVKNLASNLNITYSEAEIIFKNISESKTGILYEYFESLLGPKTGKYYYSADMNIEKIKIAQNNIDYLTFKYH